jgi:hypothetical protein
MSPRTAKTYARLVLGHGIASKALSSMHYCLSPAVARGLAALGDPRIAIASQPDLKSLLALVARGVSDLP